MMSYQFTEHGSSYPAAGKYYANSGYIQDSGRPHSKQEVGSFEPVRTYPSGGGGKEASPSSYNYHLLRAAFCGIFFCPFFGLIGLVYAILGYVDHRQNNFSVYNRRSRCATGWTVSAYVCWLLLVIVGVIVGVLFFYGILLGVYGITG